MKPLTDSSLRLGAYLLVVVLGIIGFVQVQNLNEKSERNAKVSAYELCAAVNENRQVLRSLISNGRPLQAPEGSDPAFQKFIEESNKRNAVFLQNALSKLADQDCPPNPYGDEDK